MAARPAPPPVPDAEAGRDRDEPGLGRRRSLLPAVAVLVGLCLIASSGLGLTVSSFVQVAPGPTFDLVDRVHGPQGPLDGAEDGSLLVTTVQIERLNHLEAWWRQLRGESGIRSVDEFGDPDEQRERAGLAWEEAVATAAAVARDRTGTGGDVQATGAVIQFVVDDSPAARAGLRSGDVVVEAGGRPVRQAEDLADAVEQAAGPLTLEVERAGRVVRHVIRPTGTPRRIGVGLGTRIARDPDLRVDVTGVGGPSGGLMLTLAFVDSLSPGSLTGGRRLAGTGTIALDGSVGPVAGVAEKLDAARRDGAEVFFAPARAARVHDGLTVVAVDTVDDALAWLCGHGADDEVCRR